MGDDYEGKEFQLEKNVNYNPSENQLTERNLKQILKTLIASVKETKLLYSDKQTEVISHNYNRLESFKFKVIFNNNDGSSQIFEEKSFFTKAAKFESLASLILEYCKVTDNGEEGTRIWIIDEHAEGRPAGTFAILALVDQNKKWIPKYIEFLRTNDLDHEVEQMWDIKNIIEKYGWCIETYELAIARNISCCGQAGKEQFESLIKSGLNDSLNNKNNRELFINSILKEFQEWKSFEFRLKDGSKDYYLSG